MWRGVVTTGTMSIAMAEPAPTGAPIAKDAIDPELIRLARKRPRIGLITSAGLVFLCGFFLLRLSPDRRFAGAAAAPDRVALADLAAGKVAVDRYVKIEAAELAMAHSIRASTNKHGLGLRVVPVRGSSEKVWVAMTGDGWDPPTFGNFTGRLRPLRDLPFASQLSEYAAAHPRPLFAPPAAVRAAFGGGKVATVTGEQIEVQPDDRVAFDTVDPNITVLIATFNSRLPTKEVWATELGKAGIAIVTTRDPTDHTIHFDVTGDLATVTAKLQAANLWSPTRLEPSTHHFETTWSALRGSSPAGFAVAGTTIPDAQIDLLGLYVARSLPSDAYALITDENPADYWYVLPITVALAAIGLIFAWALVRAVKRDLLSPTATS
ncbi:hypothetical protein BH11MYX1_BH11MYX1_52390 [soil metagenome]